MGPFGNVDAISDEFVTKLAADEQLVIERNTDSGGILSSMLELELPSEEYERLDPNVIDFYENTTRYELGLTVRWSPLFRIFGKMLVSLYSKRLEQLNLPLDSLDTHDAIHSEVMTLREEETGQAKYTVWCRKFVSSQQTMYSGIYGTCTLPSGLRCVKTVFPLPRGNATVILAPTVGQNGELHLESSGNRFGDPGFYFLLSDSKGGYWAQYVRSFREQLIVHTNDEGHLQATQTMTLFRQRLLDIQYDIRLKTQK